MEYTLPRLIREATQRGATPRDIMDIIRSHHQLTDSGSLAPQSFDPNRTNSIPPTWGVTMQEAANALVGMFGGGQSNRALLELMQSIERDMVSKGIDGIAPCGYEEL